MFAFLASQSTVGASPGYLPASLCGGQALNTTGCKTKLSKTILQLKHDRSWGFIDKAATQDY